MIKEIRKEDIPDWDYGDVAIKTYSIGDQNRVGNMAAIIKGTTANPDIALREDINSSKLQDYMLMAGIHFFKAKDNMSFILKPNTLTDDKIKHAYTEISQPAGVFLLGKIVEINKPLTPDGKKNLNLSSNEEVKTSVQV